MTQWMRLTGCMIHWSGTVQQHIVQVRVCRFQSRAELPEMVPVLIHQYLQKKVYFFRVGGAVSQLVAFRLAEGPAVSQNIHHSVRIRYRLHQLLVTVLQQLFMLGLHLLSPFPTRAAPLRFNQTRFGTNPAS